MNASHAIVNEEPVKERHDGADLCPMCLTELLLPTNSCPQCGAPVNAAGIIEPALPPPDPQARVQWAKWQAVLCAIASLCFIPSMLNPVNDRGIYVIGTVVYLTLTWRSWHEYRALKAKLKPASTST
jgi:hypothetical protein